MLQALADQLRQLADRVGVRTVYGEPVHAHGRTFIPVAKVTYALGVGGGVRERHEREEGEQEGDHAQGGGAGVGLVARPVALVEIQQDRTRVLPVWDANRLVLAALAAAAWVAFWLLRRTRRA
jgi:uncharacterized spore protein YtfJ